MKPRCIEKTEMETFAMPEPLVSIIVPAYNAAGCIARCVESIVSQRYQELEILLLNDPLAFAARTAAHAYSAFRVDAMQYLLLPVHQQELSALLARATEPEYGPVILVTTASGLRALPFADIEYLECTHHVVHYHLASGEDVASLSLTSS